MSFSEGASHGFRCLHIFFSATHSASIFSVSNLEEENIIIAIQCVGMSTITSFVPKSQTQTLKQSSDIWL